MCPLEAYTCGAFPLNLCGQGALFAVTCLGTREVFLYHVKGEVCLHAQMTGIPYCAAPCGEGILYAGLYEHGSAVTYMDAQTAYTIPLGGCMPTEIRPYGNQRAVVTDCASGTVSFLDLENRKIIRKLQCTSMPDDICVLPNGIAITSMEDNCILLTDFDGKEPRCVRTGIEPRGLAYSSEDNRSV